MLSGLRQLTVAHRARQLGGQLVLRGEQTPQPLVELRAEHRGQVVIGEGVDRGQQLVHDTSHALDQAFEVYRGQHWPAT